MQYLQAEVIMKKATKYLCQRSSYSLIIALMLLSSLSFVASLQAPIITLAYATSDKDDDEQQEEEQGDEQVEGLLVTQPQPTS